MKYFKYDFSTLHKVTSFLSSKTFYAGNLLGALACFSLGLLAPKIAGAWMGCLAITTIAAPIIDLGVQILVQDKKARKAGLQKIIEESLEELKPIPKKCIEKSIVMNQNNKDRIEKINADILKRELSQSADWPLQNSSQRSGMILTAAAFKDCLPDIEPLVRYYNLQLLQASTDASEQHKILDNFVTALTLDVTERICENAITLKINDPASNCFERNIKRIEYS